MGLSEKRIAVALGGNAILRSEKLNRYEDQFENVRRTCSQIAPLIAGGYLPDDARQLTLSA